MGDEAVICDELVFIGGKLSFSLSCGDIALSGDRVVGRDCLVMFIRGKLTADGGELDACGCVVVGEVKLSCDIVTLFDVEDGIPVNELLLTSKVSLTDGMEILVTGSKVVSSSDEAVWPDDDDEAVTVDELVLICSKAAVSGPELNSGFSEVKGIFGEVLLPSDEVAL